MRLTVTQIGAEKHPCRSTDSACALDATATATIAVHSSRSLPSPRQSFLRKSYLSIRLSETIAVTIVATSRYDLEHGQSEERRITLGQAETGQLVVAVHTFEELAAEARIRIISARYATARERRQYQSS